MSSITAPSPAVDPTGPLAQVSRSRRRTELIMLVFAFALVLFALANVGFTLHGKLPPGAAIYMAVYIAIVVVAHLAVRRFAPWADPLLLPLAALLNGLSIVMMFRLSAQVNPATGHLAISASQANLQIAFSAVGIGCFVAVLVLIREPRVLQRYTYTLGAVGILLVALPALLPASISEVYGAKIQIRFGSFTTIQPEEFAKLALAAGLFAGVPGSQAGRAGAGRPAGCSGSTCRGPATSARSCSPGRPACCCLSSRATSAPARYSWGCSS